MNTKHILDTIDPTILLKCYSTTTSSDKIHQKFVQMEFEKKEDRIRIYNVYVNMMLLKCMEEKGFNGLSGWKGYVGEMPKGYKRTGGACFFMEEYIKIANWIIESDITKFEDLKNTILHEIAHANAWLKYRESKHGPKWKQEARRIGCTGDRCLPKKYGAEWFESTVYKCKHPSDKCICIKSGTKRALTMFSNKIPKMVCKKHMVTFDYVETKEYDPDDDSNWWNNLSGYSFGSNEKFVLVEDGEVIDIDSDGDIVSIEPDICILYD